MKYVLGVFGFIILAVIAVILLASTTENRTDVQEGENVVKLDEYLDRGVLSFTTEGEIVGQESHHAIRILVSGGERRLQVLRGYDGQIIQEHTFANSQQAFDIFSRSLSKAGFTLERDVEEKDPRGVCPQGRRYYYSLLDAGTPVTTLWSTSCSSREGTFGGNDALVRNLFQEQIPNYNRLVNDVDL